MNRYDGRLKAIGKKLPSREMGDFEIVLVNEDGTIKMPDGRIISEEQYELETGDDFVITISDEPGTEEKNRLALERWRAGQGRL